MHVEKGSRRHNEEEFRASSIELSNWTSSLIKTPVENVENISDKVSEIL